MPTIQLRDYQERTNSEIRRAAASGAKRILAVMPTGAGKSYTFADLVPRYLYDEVRDKAMLE